ncbi:hypothetical protein FPK09_18275 [Mycobacterium tuberculosis]|nr:hypothetical protein FPK09_18275 [Mycobacterium tuberculosis]QOM40754.1 hypothetical protein FPK08_18295 [Mycobacterium tuberculosis]
MTPSFPRTGVSGHAGAVHPDICVHNKRSVRLTCWTRQMHCLTRVDFDLAEAFSAVHDEQCSQQVAR